jgi:hypothetical protein
MKDKFIARPTRFVRGHHNPTTPLRKTIGLTSHRAKRALGQTYSRNAAAMRSIDLTKGRSALALAAT